VLIREVSRTRAGEIGVVPDSWEQRASCASFLGVSGGSALVSGVALRRGAFTGHETLSRTKTVARGHRKAWKTVGVTAAVSQISWHGQTGLTPCRGNGTRATRHPADPCGHPGRVSALTYWTPRPRPGPLIRWSEKWLCTGRTSGARWAAPTPRRPATVVRAAEFHQGSNLIVGGKDRIAGVAAG
jgi:hypothetical protein